MSLRAVAAEAGVSMGRVQYYFATKDELLMSGLRLAHRRLEARIEERLRGTRGSDRDILWAMFDELLGEHPETREVIRVSSIFEVWAHDDARVAAVLTEGDDEILTFIEGLVRRTRGGEDLDPRQEAKVLFTLAGGLAGDVVMFGRPIDEARATLAYHFDRLLPKGK
jgi:AcrR family transcriptional regulator